MIKLFLKLLVLGIIVWVVYVTFYGKPEDIKLRNNLFNKSKELGLAVSEIFTSETQKVNSGEYNKVFSILDENFKELKKLSQNKDQQNEIQKLISERESIEKRINENLTNQNKLSEENKKLKVLSEKVIELNEKLQK